MSPISLRNSGVHLQGRRLLKQFLVPPLDRALAFSQADHIAVLVGQNLELDVARVLDVLLHVEIAVAERRRRFLLCLPVQSRQILLVAHDAHAAPATTRRRLDDHRVSDLPRPLRGLFL